MTPTQLSHRNPQTFGFLVTVLGVAFFFPDTLLIRLIGGDTMTIAVWRGTTAGLVTFAAIALFHRAAWPSLAQLLTWPALAMMLLQGLGSLFFLASMGQTSVANALLILATAPFLAALASWLLLREGIDRATGLAIAAVFVGVAIIASGSWGGINLLGDFWALLNAVCIALYYVVLRMVPGQNLLPAISIGYFLTALFSLPFATMEAFTPAQAAMAMTSGGVILAGGGALLMLGPRYLPAAEVSMITLLEVVVGPLIVWAALGEMPAQRSLIGGAIIVIAIAVHSGLRLAQNRTTPLPAAAKFD